MFTALSIWQYVYKTKRKQQKWLSIAVGNISLVCWKFNLFSGFQVELLNLPDLETQELTKLNYTLILYTITLKFN